MFVFFRFLFFIFFAAHLSGAQSICIDCTNMNTVELINQFPETFQIMSLSYDVDGFYDLDELNYLVGFKADSYISFKEIQRALFYLKATAKFSSIGIELKPVSSNQSYQCIVCLKKQKILARLMISGMPRDKDLLRYQYLIELGEPFDEQKHLCGMQHMKDFLHDRGYFSASIQDTIVVDEWTHFVKLYFKIKKGSRFKIEDAQVQFLEIGSVEQKDVDRLKRQLETFFLNKLKNSFYSMHQIKDVTEKMNKFLRQQGFINFKVNFEKQIHQSGRITVYCNISLERKRELVFVGNHALSKTMILDHLMAYGTLTWNFPNALIIDEIEQLYKNKGFWNVVVRLQDNKNQVFCTIIEAERSLINNVIVHDNDIIDQKLLKKTVKSCLKKRYADKDVIKKLNDKLLLLCKAQGYWNAQVVDMQYVQTGRLNYYDLHIFINVNMQKTVGKITVHGPNDVVQKCNFTEIYSGRFFDPCFLHEQKQKIYQLLHATFLHCSKLEHELVEQPNNVVDVIWTIQLQDKTIPLGKAIIVGNSTVPHALLINEVEHVDGQIGQALSLQRTVQNFKKLPVYDQVQLYPSCELDPFLYKPIFIKLIEDDRYQIRTRFGMQQVGRNLQVLKGFTYKFGGSICINNLSNAADQTFIEGDITKFYRNISIGYQFPWLFKKNIGSQWKFYDTSYDQPVFIGSQDSLYKATQQGFLFNANHTIQSKGAYVLINGSLGCEFLGLFEADQPDLGSIINYDSNLIAKRVGYVYAQPTILIEKIDSMLNPTQGFIGFLSIKAMGDLQARTSFVKMLVEYTHYIPIHDQIVCALRGRAGHVFNRAFDQINPIERFYLGGAVSVRGYERDYCPPLGLLTKPIYNQHAGLPACSNDVWRYAAQGGRTMFNINSEVRFQLYKNIGLVVFTDFGALFQNSIRDSWVSFKDSVCVASGTGLRYDTPIGPLRFDIGWKWKVQDSNFETRSVWYLTLGQAF